MKLCAENFVIFHQNLLFEDSLSLESLFLDSLSLDALSLDELLLDAFLMENEDFCLTHILPCTLDACMCKKPCPKLETEYILVLFGYNKRQVNCFHYRTSYWHLLFMLIASQPHFVNRSINMT